MPVLARYLTAAALARLADEGSRVVLILLALQQTHRPAFGGALVGAFMVPHVLAAPAIGALADRVRRRKPLYAVCLLAYAAALAGCGLLTGRVPDVVVLLVAVLGGCFAPLVTGGLSSLLRDLVPAGRRARAYALDVTSYNVAGIAGPAVAAFLATALDTRSATVAVAAGAAVGALLLLTLPLPARQPDADAARFAATAGAAAIWRDRTLRAVTAASSLGAVGMGVLPLVAALLAVEYHAGFAAGALLSAAAAGGLAGALAYTRRPVWTDRPERVVLVCLVAGGLPLALVPVLPGVAAGLVLFGVSGFFTGPQASALFTSRDRHAPPAVHAQVFTLGAGLKITAAAAGAAAAGLAAGIGGDGLLLAVAGCQTVAAGVGAAILRT